MMSSRSEQRGILDIVFFGSGAFGVPTLEMLATDHRIVLIITQPDRRAGRGRKLTPTPVAQWAADNHPDIPIIKPDSIADADAIERVAAAKAHAIVVIAYGQKIPASIYDSAPCVNLHGSALPKWRGAAPIHRAILGGDTTTGVCVIHVEEKMDTGNVITSAACAINPMWTTSDLHDQLSALGPDSVTRVLDDIASGRDITGQAQSSAGVFHARKISRDDAWIDFAQSADECRRRVNSLSPSPGVLVTIGSNGTDAQKMKIVRATSADSDRMPNAQPGTIVDATRGRVRCGDCRDLVLMDVQPTGKPAMRWPEFVRGYAAGEGEMLVSVQPKR